MKTFLLVCLFSLTVSAQAGCIGEAQILGKVQNVVKTLSSCKVFLTNDTLIQSSGVCPLDEGKLYSEGAVVGMLNGHDCAFNAGDSISGILVDNGSFIYLE